MDLRRYFRLLFPRIEADWTYASGKHFLAWVRTRAAFSLDA